MKSTQKEEQIRKIQRARKEKRYKNWMKFQYLIVRSSRGNRRNGDTKVYILYDNIEMKFLNR